MPLLPPKYNSISIIIVLRQFASINKRDSCIKDMLNKLKQFFVNL